MTLDEAKDLILEYFENNEDDFIEVIEDLDSWCGYLGDDRYYYMEELDELYHDQPATEILYRAFYGHDGDTWETDSSGNRTYEEFNPNRTYFYFNGYGNFVSSDYKDYSSHLDMYFIEKVIERADDLSLPDEVKDIIEQIGDEENV